MSIVPLAEAGPECGGKAYALGRLLRAGFPVPDGFVVIGPVDARAIAARLGDRLFAVRSSGLAEDSAGASFAGQYDTVLNVPKVDVAAVVGRCAAGTGRAREYGRHLGIAERPIPVLVQDMVDADTAGVLFTTDPVLINAVRGLGDALVSGRVPPEDCLSPGETERLVALGRRCAGFFAAPQDVEWAIADGRAWVLQSRPITAPITALGAGAGRASGPVRIVRSADDFGRVRRGDVLVCRTTDPAWTPLFRIAAAVVTETGGVLCHAAIVAREFGIPAVVGVGPSIRRFAEGTAVTVDAAAGTVVEERA